jgi:DNA (cytosine-5)-methyltransferase 1
MSFNATSELFQEQTDTPVEAPAHSPKPSVKKVAKKTSRSTSTPLFGEQVAEPAKEFTFIDLFAGIGGFRLGLDRNNGKCVFTSEWDKYSQQTYKAWYGDQPHGDITKIIPDTIPDHDILAAGFPCQPFSLAGVSKKISLGREHGFRDATQGTMFFHVASIIEVKRPKVAILENVKNLMSHDKGQTWKVIKGTMEEMGYAVFHKVIDAADYVPQHRERVFIVCFDTHVFGPKEQIPFEFPETPEGPRPAVRNILDPEPADKYTLTDHLWQYLQNYAEKHRQAGNGFGFGLVNLDGVTRTISARYHKDGAEILIPQGRGKNPRRLTPMEAKRLMGFPDKWPIVVSDTQAYRQFGNALVPLIAEAVGGQVVKVLHWHKENEAAAKKKAKKA